jgi:hypothetical protein
VKKELLALAAAAAIEAAAPAGVSAQTWWTPRAVVDAGAAAVIVRGPVTPTVVVAPVFTTAKIVTAGPVLRVSGCYWTRERVPGRWLRFRVCS